MRLADLSGKKICILGFGREGQATLAAIEKHNIPCEITIADQNPTLKTTNYKLKTGPSYLQGLEKFDVIIKSPGIPPQALLTTNYQLLTSATQIFFDTIEGSGATVIGITGSKGKSTTASLIYEILKTKNYILKTKNCYLIGNIGEPALNHLEEAHKKAVFVMEMSSFQLMDLTKSPKVAVITSFFPEHLDYHGSIEAYRKAKEHITKFQGKDDIVFFNSSSEGARVIAERSIGRKVAVTEGDCPIPLSAMRLRGRHNLTNAALAAAVARYLGISEEAIRETLQTFEGLPHRLQSLGIHDGIEWIDDAIATTPESTIAALDALEDSVTTLIVGGQDRGNDFQELGRRIARSRVSHVILMPESGHRIREATEAAGARATLHEASTMEEAVEIVKGITGIRGMRGITEGAPLALLSPASPSYNQFTNFEEKGATFRRAIMEETRTTVVY